MSTTGRIHGQPITKDGDTRIVNIRNCDNHCSISSPANLGDTLTVDSNQAQDKAEEWKLICINAAYQTYHIQSVKNDKGFAWAPNAQSSGGVMLQNVAHVWKIDEPYRGSGRYTVSFEDSENSFWTINDTTTGTPVMLDEYGGAVPSTFTLCDVSAA